MIKSVSIQNFEAHEDTTVQFGDGMNSIVGLSNSGKSAIIRALMVVVDNEWSKEMVRTGYEFCHRTYEFLSLFSQFSRSVLSDSS